MSEESFTPTLALPPGFFLRSADLDDIDDLLEVERLSQGAPWTRRVFEKE